MAFGIDDILLALPALGTAIAGMFQKDDIPPELQKAYKLLGERAERGLGSGTESLLRESGARQISAAQRRMASSLASRGMSSSSVADTALGEIGAAGLEVEKNIALLNEQAKQEAQNALLGVSGDIASIREARRTARGESLGGLMGILTDRSLWEGLGIVEPKPDAMEQLLSYFEGLGSQKSPAPELKPIWNNRRQRISDFVSSDIAGLLKLLNLMQ
jgi:hypothetical protein